MVQQAYHLHKVVHFTNLKVVVVDPTVNMHLQSDLLTQGLPLEIQQH
jgi:hypothetical protein